MKKHIFSAAFAVAGLVAATSGAYAADGIIDIKGSVVANTCTINGGAANANFSVTLPTVSTTSLSAAGATAGRTPFTLSLTGCTGSAVSTYFEPGSTVNANGRLIVDAGGATNVDLQLLSDTYQAIKAGAAQGSQNSQQVAISGGNATLNYYVEYYATAAATAGAANSRVQYTLVYQ